MSPQAVPTVSSFSPTSGPVGTAVGISGTGFTGITSVTFNNIAAAFTVNSSSSITATVPAGASTGRVRVINADGTGQSATNFTFVPAPTITTFTATARVGQTVTVNGTALGSASSVTLNGSPVAFTQVSGTRVTFVVPVGATSGFITVTTAAGTATSSSQFVVRPDLPTISSFTPASGAIGITTVTISGTNFTGATTVRFNTTDAPSFTVVNSSTITTTVPTGATTGRIRVITGGGTAVSATNFTVAAVPTVTSINPIQGAPGATVVVRGTSFVNVSSVRFNGTNASFTVTSSTRLTTVVPFGATTGAITVTTPSGSASSATFTVNPSAPVIASFTPSSGNVPNPPTLGTQVSITGSNFVGGAGNTTVFFNGVQATTVTFVNTGLVRARVPVGATTGPITVATSAGSAVSATDFAINNSPPTITGTVTQRGCANSQLVISYTVGDAQTPANDLSVLGTSPGAGTIITFNPDNVGVGTSRSAVVEAINPAVGGSTTLQLTVTDGSGSTASITFNITLDPTLTAGAGSDQSVAAGQDVALEGTATGAASTLWTSSGSGSFSDATAAAAFYTPSQADYVAGSVTLTFTASPATGSTCAPVADALLVTFSRGDLIVFGNETINGIYNNVLVVAGATPTVQNLDVAGSLTVQSGASLSGDGACAPITGTGTFTLEDGATLNVCHPQGIAGSGPTGQIRVTGSRSYGAGATYAYVGSGSQFSGTGLPFNLTGTLIVDNNGGGVDLSSNLRLHTLLRLVDGDLRTADVAFIVVSNAAGTGVIENVGGVVSGMAVIQRYLATTLSTGLGYHHLSSPVQSTTVGDLSTTGFTAVVNPLYNSAANPGAVRPFPNVYGFDETRGGAIADFGRGYFSPTALNSTLESGRGYSVYISSGLTTDFVGVPTTGTVTRAGLTRTGNFSGNTQKSGWHLMGNPYPSPIDWDLVTIPAGMSPAISVWRSTGGVNGSYAIYTNGTGTPGADLLGIGQAGFVRVTGASPVDFSFENSCRVTSTNVPVFRAAAVAVRSQVVLRLRATTASEAEATEAYVYFQDGATAGYDVAFDGARPGRNVGVPTLATVAGTEELAVNALAPAALAGSRLPLVVEVPAAGTYELTVSEFSNLDGAAVYLLDGLTGTAQALTADARYTFTAAGAGELPGRFALRFGAASASTTAEAVSVAPNPAMGRTTVSLSGTATRLTLVDALGRTVRTLALSAGQTEANLDVQGLSAGVYTLRAGAVTTRLMVE